jgi:hypothetical protein
VLISLIGIFTGIIVVFGMVANKRLDRWTKWFLITTVLTSVTGFFFPLHGFTPAIGVGIISLIVLGIAIIARYPRQMADAWRWIYIVTAVIALYFNVFVLIMQSFQKIPALHALAPTQTEPPFKSTQLIVLALSLCLPLPRPSGFASNGSVRLQSKRHWIGTAIAKGECLAHLSLAFRFP